MPALNLPVFLEPNRILIPGGTTSANIKAAITAAPADSEIIFTGACSVSDWGATPFVLSKRLWLVGDGCGVLTGNTAYTQKLFDIRAPVRFRGLKFNQLASAIEFNATTGSKLDFVEFNRCEFWDVVNPILAPLTYSGGPTIGVKRIVISGCESDASNLTLHDPGLGVRASDGNPFIDFAAPVDSGDVVNCYERNARRGGVWFGHEDQAQSGSIKKVNVDGFVLETGRAGQNGSSNNFQAVLIRACLDATVTNCRISDLETADNDDVEGIYTKSVRTVVANNTLVDAGHHDAAIVAKGNPRGGGGTGPDGWRNTIVNNQITFTQAYTDGKLQDTRGIRTLEDDVFIAGNVIEGATGDGIVCGLHTAHTNNITVRDNDILGHRQVTNGDCGIRISAGSYITVEHNSIFVIPQSGVAGRCIRLQPTDATARKSWVVSHNLCNVAGGAATSRGIIVASASDIDYLECNDNDFSGVQNGIRFENGVTLSWFRGVHNRFKDDVATPIAFADETNTPTRYWITDNPGASPTGVYFTDGDQTPSVLRYNGGLFYATNYTADTAISRFDGLDSENGNGIDDGTVIHIMMPDSNAFQIQHNQHIKTIAGIDLETGLANRIFSFMKVGGTSPVWLQIGDASGSAPASPQTLHLPKMKVILAPVHQRWLESHVITGRGTI